MANPDIIKRESGNMGSVSPILGTPLEYDDGYDVEENKGIIWGGDDKQVDDFWDKFHKGYHETGVAAQRGMSYGLPQKITGRPLGCGCNVAYLHGVGEVKDGQVEADYMCDSGWHNFVVIQLKTKEKKQQVQIDKSGNLVMGGEGYKATELEEY